VLGDPLRYTRSPDLHRAGCESLGLACESVAIRTPASGLEAPLGSLAAQGYLGVNLTHPLKADVLRFVPDVADAARRARSVNTVGFAAPGWWGCSTDGPGFLDLLAALGRDPAQERVVMLGAGGSARSLALALEQAGCGSLVVTARNPEKRAGAWADLSARGVAWRSDEEADALGSATLVVNCTPLSNPEHIVPLERVARAALLVDLVYEERPTEWVRAARARGRRAIDGLGLLVHQARRSLELWFERDVPLAPLEQAVGWPR